MSENTPYSFWRRSRKAMESYVLDRRGYSNHYTLFHFSWCVKAHGVNRENPRGDYAPRREFDRAWAKEAQAPWRFDSAIEVAQSHYAVEWCSYPGDDQGAWKFGFYGRQGGRICLETWQGHKMYGRNFDRHEWLAELPFEKLKAFYRALVCMDSDFTPDAARINVESYLNYQRHEWEDTQLAEREASEAAFAASYEASRPDMYGATA